jgi:hypothetical protein
MPTQISYPLDFTGLLKPARVRFIADDVVGESVSPFTRQQQVYNWQADELRVEIDFPPAERAEADDLIANLLALRGLTGTFLMRPPGYRTPRGAGAAETPVVMGAQSAGAAILETDGWTPGSANRLLRGDWIQVLGDDGVKRLHKVLAPVNPNAYGAATLDIWPRLRFAVSDNAAITLVDPVGTFRLASNERAWTIEVAMIYGLQLSAVEVLRP